MMSKTDKAFFKKCIVEFHAELLPQFGTGSAEQLDKIIDNLTSDENFVYIIKPNIGMIIGYVQPYLFNPDLLVLSEIGWYVLPHKRGSKAGFEMVKEFEDAAKDIGVDIILMATLGNNDISRFYEKNGYNLQEKFYYKEV